MSNMVSYIAEATMTRFLILVCFRPFVAEISLFVQRIVSL